jgi:hypothetical protein
MALALLRAAAAGAILLALAPEQTRQAVAAIFLGVEEARRAAPTKEDVAAAALAYCRSHPDVCTRAATEAEKKLRP